MNITVILSNSKLIDSIHYLVGWSSGRSIIPSVWSGLSVSPLVGRFGLVNLDRPTDQLTDINRRLLKLGHITMGVIVPCLNRVYGCQIKTRVLVFKNIAANSLIVMRDASIL